MGTRPMSVLPADQLPLFTHRVTTHSDAGASGQLLVGRDAQRVGIVISNTGGFDWSVLPEPVTLPGTGILLPPAASPLSLIYRDWGGVVAEEWHGNGGGLGGTLTVLEVIYTPTRREQNRIPVHRLGKPFRVQ